MADPALSDPQELFTEGAPEYGDLLNHDVIITSGVYWVEDNGRNHVFRSLEFDVMGEGGNKDTALVVFIENILDHVMTLIELIREGEATDHEVEVFTELSDRYLEAFRRHENEKRPLIEVNLLRRARQHGRSWRSTPTPSKIPSPA